jgi:predicted DNA-binding transcriptional regulator AlpA
VASWKIPGPDEEWLDLHTLTGVLGGVSEDVVRRLIAAGRFPRPVRAGSQSPPRWHASAVAAWLYLQPMMHEEGGGGGPQPQATAGNRRQPPATAGNGGQPAETDE